MIYVNHSGGAEGADTVWEADGQRWGVKTVAYSFDGHKCTSPNRHNLTPRDLEEGWEAAKIANRALGRPLERIRSHYVRHLIARNWFQTKNAESVLAVGRLVDHYVDGGTGWAVQMAVDNKKPVYVFDQDRRHWFLYDFDVGGFCPGPVPSLTENFAGIGTRALTHPGKLAIHNVYERHFNEPRSV